MLGTRGRIQRVDDTEAGGRGGSAFSVCWIRPARIPNNPMDEMEISWWSRARIGEVLHVTNRDEGRTNFPV